MSYIVFLFMYIYIDLKNKNTHIYIYIKRIPQLTCLLIAINVISCHDPTTPFLGYRSDLADLRRFSRFENAARGHPHLELSQLQSPLETIGATSHRVPVPPGTSWHSIPVSQIYPQNSDGCYKT